MNFHKNKEWPPRCCRKVCWTKMVRMTILVKMTLFRTGETKMVHSGPYWPEGVHFGPLRSTNRTLAIPERRSSQYLKRTKRNTTKGTF